MPYTPEAYAYTPVNYVGESGRIPALLLYERDGLSYLRFQTKNWPHYDGWGFWSTVGIFSEHVAPADPHEPAVADLLHELEKEVVAYQHQPSIRERVNSAVVAKAPPQINGQGATTPKTCAKVVQGNGVKPVSPQPVKPARAEAVYTNKNDVNTHPVGNSARGRRASGKDARSLKPVRSIAGLTLADFSRSR